MGLHTGRLVRLQPLFLGLGVMQNYTLNNHLQLCHNMASSAYLPIKTGLGNVFDRSLLYATGSLSCSNTSGNSGNISNLVDNLVPGNTQSFTYDNLNRVTGDSQSGGSYNQNYTYDSFGNMIPHDNIYTNPSYSVDAATNRSAMNGSLTSGNLQYNAAGYLTTAPFPGGSLHANVYTAEGFLRCIDSCNTGSYLTNGLAERTLAVRSNTASNQYVYLNGHPMADLDSLGNRTDYIYANGQEIARGNPAAQPIHLSGTVCSSCGGSSTNIVMNGANGRPCNAARSPVRRHPYSAEHAGHAILSGSPGGFDWDSAALIPRPACCIRTPLRCRLRFG